MDSKSVSQNDSESLMNEAQMEECESFWLLRGPPFDQRDYMISPSDSGDAFVSNICEEESTAASVKISPSEVKVDDKYILDAEGALKKLLELKSVECIQPLLGRIKNLIYTYLCGRPTGFLVGDLPAIIELIEYFSEKQKSFVELTHHLLILIDFAKKPPIMNRCVDIFKCKKILADYFTMFGELLAIFEHECFQIEILNALNSIIFRRDVSHINSVRLSLCIEALEESQLPYAIAALLETVCFHLYDYYLEIATNISMVSVKAGFLMARCNVLNFILKKLNVIDIQNLCEGQSIDSECENDLNNYYSLLDKTSYLIWGVLTAISKKDFDVPSPDDVALRILKNIFEREIMKKSQKALDARNNLAGIIIKLCSVFNERLPVCQAGLVEDIAVLSVLSELGAQKSCFEGFKMGAKKEDYYLKKLMLLGCCLLPKDIYVIEALKKFRIVEGIAVLLNYKTTGPWISSQFFNIFRLGLRTLSELVPFLPEEFVRWKVGKRILSLLIRHEKEEFEENCLEEILSTVYIMVTSENNDCIVKDLKAQNGEKFLLEFCLCLIDCESMTVQRQDKLCKVFLMLEKLLKNDENLLILHSEDIVSMAIALLQRILMNSNNDSKWDPKLLINFGSFIWEAIAVCNASLKKFIEQGGTFLFLDFLEGSSFPIQMFFLGILVDMTLEGENIAHLLTWRGKDGYGVLDLMINIWKKEELITKVGRTSQGFIEDIEKPLMTEDQWLLTQEVENSHNYCPSVAEMVGSARPKIHAMYHFLNQQYADLMKIGESSYSVQFLNVRPSNQIYVPLVEHYLSLKMGEIWYEVLRDISINGISPTGFDGDVMCTLLVDKRHWSSRIRTMQEEIASSQEENGTEAVEEKKFYNLLNSCRLTPALEALRELDYVGRTSLSKFQRERKNQQIQMVEKSLEALAPDYDIHRTFLIATNITFQCMKKTYIQSENITTFDETLPLSSELSDDNHFDSCDEI